MNSKKRQRSLSLILLIILLILLSLGGFGGGISMFIDPSGTGMGLPSGLLDGLPINNFILPGFFLVAVMGITPLVVAWGLWKQSGWSRKAAIAQSVILVMWILFQIILWGNPITLQIIYLLWGVFMLVLCFLPGVRKNQ